MMNHSNLPTKNKTMKSVMSNPEKSQEEILKRIENEEFQKRANIQMNKIVIRFLNYKREELKLENYTDEEIENIIENIIYTENEYDLDYYSSSEDDDSVYSDEDTF
jgi:hypothetical protein